MSDEQQPYDPKDPYWLFKEVAAFERRFAREVQQPMLEAMLDQFDRAWDEANPKDKRRS
jgi:hypothetical protein